MKRLDCLINELDQSHWNYYEESAFKNPYKSHDVNHEGFIKKYFELADKKEVLDLKKFKKKSDEINKPEHACSIFFIGILLYHKVEMFRDNVSIHPKTCGTVDFSFYWFLICFYHDYGMHIEDEENFLEKFSDLVLLKKELKISNCLLGKDVEDCPQYLFDNIRNYFYYRRFVFKKIDHGIVAGLYLYDKLVENRDRKKKEKQNNSELCWDKELDQDYATIATAIACHNIWFPQNDDDACSYIRFDMDSLINVDPISLNDYPLLYLLGIVDTIDPIKIYGDEHNEQKILQGISMGFPNKNSLNLEITDSEIDTKKMKDKSKNLDGWLDVSLSYGENSVIINFNDDA